MTDFLLELRSEEIPARMQARAREDLARLFAAELSKSGLAASETITYATPRRVTLIARGLPDATEAASEELKGPRASAPPQALDGFLRKTGLTREQLTERDGILYAVTEKPGRAAAGVLAEAIPAIVRAFPWPKSMRWGEASRSTESLRWVRPLHGVVALFGEEVVECEIAGVKSSAATLGHRFHHPGPITIGSAADYVEKLRACHVIVDPEERESIIALGATQLAAEAGLDLIRDEGLLAENAGLTEWPVPLLGRFDEAFLDVPPEVIQLTARVNQKYFVCVNPPRHGEGDHPKDGGGGPAASGALNSPPPPSGAGAPATSPSRGGLANAFVCVADIDAVGGGAKIVDGNRKVLAARLADARFFYETDLKTSLEEQAKKLDRIVFHEKLGTVADKVERVAKLARWLVEEGVVKSSPGRGGGPSRSDGGGGADSSAAPGSTPPPPRPSGEFGDELPPAIQTRAGGTSGPKLPLPVNGEDRDHLAALAERAALLCKADLVTQMVGEFPELQGVMGGYYAAAQGEEPRVAAAIRDHYKPVGQGDAVPTDPVTVAVSLADKLDTLVGYFAVNERPTGSKDPMGLRRSALALLRFLSEFNLHLPAGAALEEAFVNLTEWPAGYRQLRATDRPSAHESIFTAIDRNNFSQYRNRPLDLWFGLEELGRRSAAGLSVGAPVKLVPFSEIKLQILDFFADRLKVQQREAGVRHDLIDAVFALGGEDDLVRLLARVRALQAFIGTDDGANLLIGYKRAANILKKEGWAPPLPSGEGQGASAPRGEGGREASDAALTLPLGSAERAPPSPDGRGKPLFYTPEPAETALIAALDSAEPRAAEAVAREDFEGAMAALATLRAPIDAFFDTVTVNDPDETKRAARLALLARVRDAVHTVADFSKIEG